MKASHTMECQRKNGIPDSGAGTRSWLYTIGACCVFLAMAMLISGALPYRILNDSDYYVRMAAGDTAHIQQPFCARILHPLTVRVFSRALNLSTDSAFVIIGVIALSVLVVAILSAARVTIGRVVFTSALLLSPYLVETFRQYYMPDLIHSAMIGLFFLCLVSDKPLMAIIMIYPLFLIRESTLLLSVVVVLTYCRRRSYAMASAAALATLFGILTVHFATAGASANVHNMLTLPYMLGKAVYNPLNNLGLKLWANTFITESGPAHIIDPLLTIHVPSWMPLGSLKTIWILGFKPQTLLENMLTCLTLFGVLPTVLVRTAYRAGWRSLAQAPDWLLVALMYGGSAFLAGVCIGQPIWRLIGYGWPVFWIATPYLLGAFQCIDRGSRIRLASLNAVCAWLPFLAIDILHIQGLAESFALIAAAVVLHWSAAGVLRRTLVLSRAEAKSAPTTFSS